VRKQRCFRDIDKVKTNSPLTEALEENESMKTERLISSLFLICVLILSACSGSKSPQIMSWEEYSRLSLRGPYVLNLQTQEGSLLYYGAEHTADLKHPQFSDMEKLWQEFKPSLTLSEGGVWPLEKSKEEAINRHGEQGFLRYLTDRDDIPVKSLEPESSREVALLLKEYSAEQIKVFYTLRQVSQQKRMGQTEPLEEYVKKFLEVLSREEGLDGMPQNLKEFEESVTRVLPTLKNWQEVPDSWFRPTKKETWTNEMNRKISDYRNQHMVELIVNEVKKGERVFAVIGFSHVVMQEPALRKALRQK